MSESLRRSAHLRCAGELTVALARRFDSERVGEAGAAEEDAEETKEEEEERLRRKKERAREIESEREGERERYREK